MAVTAITSSPAQSTDGPGIACKYTNARRERGNLQCMSRSCSYSMKAYPLGLLSVVEIMVICNVSQARVLDGHNNISQVKCNI